MSFQVFLFLLIIVNANWAMAQQSLLNQDPRVKALYLETFDVAQGAPASCGSDCTDVFNQQVAWINAWSCIAKACNANDKGPSSCVDQFSKDMDVPQKESFDRLICNLVKSPGSAPRQALMQAFPSTKEMGYVEGSAFVDAFEGNSMACQNEIKNFLGPYGPAWNVRSFVDMSGCRILSKERTRQDEENDYASWAGGNCSKIVNTQMRTACSTSGVSFPDGTSAVGN